MKVCVIGMGYVGLPLSLHFAQAGVAVLGLDTDAGKVASLNEGRSYLLHISDTSIQVERARGFFEATSDYARLSEAAAVVICVPTPLTPLREPDLSFVLGTGRSIAPHLRPGTLVVLESTTYPGTTEDELRPLLEQGSGLRAGVDFFLAYSPEREDPGRPQAIAASVPKLVGGLTPACLERALALYQRIIVTPVPVSSCRVAEAAKLLENTFRAVNIALVNELKVVYAAMGIDIWEVVAAAGSKPFGFMPFHPGPGLGGHCIPIDPFYLTWKARQHGQATRFIELAGEINTAMPRYVVERVGQALQSAGKPVKGSQVLLVGLAYKPNVDDDRESPTYALLDLLKVQGALVSYYDPYLPVIRTTRDHATWAGTRSVSWNEASIRSFDVVVVVTAHACLDFAELAAWAQLIVDTRNALAGHSCRPNQVWKA